MTRPRTSINLRDLEESIGRRVIMPCAVCGAQRPRSIGQREDIYRDRIVVTVECHGEREEVEIDRDALGTPGFSFVPFVSRRRIEPGVNIPIPVYYRERAFVSDWIKLPSLFGQWPLLIMHDLGETPAPQNTVVYLRDDAGAVMQLTQSQWRMFEGGWISANDGGFAIDLRLNQPLPYDDIRIRATVPALFNKQSLPRDSGLFTERERSSLIKELESFPSGRDLVKEMEPFIRGDDFADALRYATLAREDPSRAIFEREYLGTFIRSGDDEDSMPLPRERLPRGARLTVSLPPEQLAALQAMARAAGVTVDQALQTLLARSDATPEDLLKQPSTRKKPEPWAPGRRRIKLEDDET